MVMLISRRVGIVRLDAVISENLAQAAGSVVETGQEAAVSARGDKLITIVGSIVDHAPADEPLPSLLPMEGGSRALNEYRVRKGIAALTSLQGASGNGGRASGIPPLSRSVHHARCCPANRRKRIEPDHNRQPEACAAGRR